MRDLDELAKYMCDKIAKTLTGYGRKVKRAGDHALIVSSEYPWEWRILVRRTGIIEIEPSGTSSFKYPIPNLVEHIRDALVGEYDFTFEPAGGSSARSPAKAKVELRPRALPKAPIALPPGT